MPGRDAHLDQARHNSRFYTSFDRNAYRDWAATVLFYTGLQYIDAFLATRSIPVHPKDHDMRDDYVARVQELRPIAIEYLRLKNRSRAARYNPPVAFTAQDIQKLEQDLHKIETELRRYVPI